jgi:NAD(P)-dependent dehydrogenase (short-subunit alcohol dehydrogenase family)
MKRLEDKVCVITGGANGIGHASVLRFLSEGARVVLADANEEAAQEKTRQIVDRGDGERIRFFPCDVSEETQVMRMVKFAVDEFGRLDCIFNNAGVGGPYSRLVDTRVEDWDHTLAYLLRSTFLGIKHAAIAMLRQKTEGSIVNSASAAAKYGDVTGAAYSAAKAGVISLTRTAAVQLGKDRIRVNAVCPGFIPTPLLLHGQDGERMCEVVKKRQAWPEVGRPEHVAAVVAFLASDEARFVTGEKVVIDGGFNAGGPGLYDSGNPLGDTIIRHLEQAGVQRFDFGNTGLTEKKRSAVLEP